ncbi:hypothetical protein GOBAR_AA06361 [Gossypium barbadense]|uniref:Uncharacterized protein n=1 Tax=Gossypium barbadense TaxID=3634 RepID=A0A2P5YF22_GOSBA|nr:hypothetical protein GOBAR_AA06361 [Gossypium barbadense]
MAKIEESNIAVGIRLEDVGESSSEILVDGKSFPNLPGIQPDLWKGPKWDVLGFLVQDLLAFGIVFTVNSTDVVILPALDISEDEEVFHTPPESRSTNASSDNCNNNDDPVIVDCEAVANSGRKSAPETEIQNLQNHGSNFEVGEGSVRVRVSSHEGRNLGKRVLPSWANPRVKGDEEAEIKETNLPSLVKGSVCDGERVEQEPVHPSTASGPSRENHAGVNDVDELLQVGKDGDDEEEEKLICVSILEVAEKKWGPF